MEGQRMIIRGRGDVRSRAEEEDHAIVIGEGKR